MKKILLFCTCVFFSFYSGCKKEQSNNNNPDNSLINEARNYFNTEVLPEANVYIKNQKEFIPTLLKSPVWDRAYVQQLPGREVVVVPISYKIKMLVHSSFSGPNDVLLDSIARLVIYKTADKKYHAEVVTGFPDSNYINMHPTIFTGFAAVEDWVGNSTNNYFNSTKDGLKELKTNQQQISAQNANHNSSNNKTTNSVIYLPPSNCYTFYYTSDGSGIYGVLDGVSPGELSGYTYAYYECATPGTIIEVPDTYDGPLTPGNYITVCSGSSDNTGYDMTTLKGPCPISGIASYMSNFKNAAGATYSISLDVNQPIPGTRSLNGPATNGSGGSDGKVGHTFLVLTETDPSGLVTTRNVGFYPATTAGPTNQTAPGQLNNNQNHQYNIGLVITVDAYHFMSLVAWINDGSNSATYDLSTYNCTTWSIDALAAGAGVNILTSGTSPIFPFENPGDLGEDIRAMTLPSNMTKVIRPGNALLYSGSNSNGSTSICN
jgi:hypothetical protein